MVYLKNDTTNEVKKKQDTFACSICKEENPSLVHFQPNYDYTKMQRQLLVHLSSVHALTLPRSHNSDEAFLVPSPAPLIRAGSVVNLT